MRGKLRHVTIRDDCWAQWNGRRRVPSSDCLSRSNIVRLGGDGGLLQFYYQANRLRDTGGWADRDPIRFRRWLWKPSARREFQRNLHDSHSYHSQQVFLRAGGTGFDSIASHQPNDLWKGAWSTSKTYGLNEQVTYGIVGYSSLQASNTGHQPDTSPTYWQVYTVPPNYATGAVASFAPTTAGTFNFWVGVRDGAFQEARAAITLVVVTEGAHFVDLNWDASLGADSYNIYRGSSSSGPYAKQNGSPIVPTGWTDTAVTSGTIYYYVATAQNAGGESGYSNEAAVAVP
jgi:hypothetical protein